MTVLAILLLVVYLTFVHYSAVMNLQRARDAKRLTVLQLPFAYCALAVGLLLDAVLNVMVCVLVLVTVPRDWLLTMTLIRFKRAGPGNSHLSRWRYRVASVICGELLDSLDPHPSGCHCRTD